MCFAFGPVSYASCHVYVIESVPRKSFYLCHLMSMWGCKYSHGVSCFHLTKICYMQMSIRGVIILVADEFTRLGICLGE